MSRTAIITLSVFVSALLFFAACEKRGPLIGPPVYDTTVRLSGLSGCETGTSLAAVVGQDRLQVDEKDGIVSFEHSGAVFNCCLDSVSFALESVRPGVVRILETEHAANACRYNCDFTVFGEIVGLEGGLITIEVANAAEPEKILCSGTFCNGCDTSGI